MKRLLIIFALISCTTGCAVQLSKKTCTSLQNVSMNIMNDRQAGLSKEDAMTKLMLFTSGKPDSKYFFEVASKIIDAAYIEPVGTTDSEKASITSSFVSHINDKCLSGEISPTYNPAPRIAPAHL